MHSYTIHKNGSNVGPLTLEQAKAGLADGTFAASDLAWRPGVPQWAPLAQRLAEDGGAVPPPLPASVAPNLPATPAKSGLSTGALVGIILGVVGVVMIVVIGLLAALAIPAFKKVRNTAIEKTMINDARQISSAFNQICAEEAKEEVTLKELRAYLPGLSNGTKISLKPGTPPVDFSDVSADSLKLHRNGTFMLVNPRYDHGQSMRPEIQTQTVPEPDAIVFETTDGTVLN